MRPSSLRQDRQKQYAYLTQQEYDQQIRQQIEEKRMRGAQEKLQQEQEILEHYKNYSFGGGPGDQDLRNMVQQKEREIERQRQEIGAMKEDGRSRQGAGFQGDMNELARMANQNRTQVDARQNFSQRMPTDLFSEDFIKNIRGAGLIGNTSFDLGTNMIPGQQQVPSSNRNNENHNIINSIFGNAGVPPSIQLGSQTPLGAPITPLGQNDNDRERRLQLRDLERKKRMEGIIGGDYGQVQNQANVASHPNTATGGSRRDQIWQEKMMQRVGSHDGSRPMQQPNVSIYLPINQNSAAIQHQDSGSLRSSRLHGQLSDAIKLDQSLNYQELMQLQMRQAQAQTPNIINQNQPVAPQSHLQNPLLGVEDDVIKRRKELERNQRKQDYNDYLAKQAPYYQQQQPPPQQQQTHVSAPHSAQQQQRQTNILSSNPLDQPLPSTHVPSAKFRTNTSSTEGSTSSVLQAAGGLNVLGLHQLKKDEDKARMQREYRQMLDLQAAEAQTKKDPVQAARRKEVSDKVFAEIMNKGPNAAPQQYYEPQQPVAKQIALETGGKNENGAPPMFFKQSEEDRKRAEQEKKREYAVFLQQQMAAVQQQKSQSSDSDQRKRRGGSIQPHQSSQVDVNQSIGSAKIFDYSQQQPSAFQPAQQQPQQFQGFQQPDPFLQYQQQAPPQQQFYPAQQPVTFQQYQPQVQVQAPQYPQSQQQPSGISQVLNQINQPTTDASQKEAQRQKQEVYRRDLELQIKLKEDQKQQKSQDLARPPRPPGAPSIQQQAETSFAMIGQMPQPPPSQGGDQPNFVRQRTDVSTGGNGQDDADRRSRQQQYQEELKRQVEDRNRQKEEEKRRLKQEEENIERRMQQQQQELAAREQRELQKEGRGAPKEERKRNVRRDLFEPSTDNPTYTAPPVNQQAKREEENYNQAPSNRWQQPEQPSYNPPPYQEPTKPLDLPTNNRREDFFTSNHQPSYQDNNRYSYEPSSNPFPSSLQGSNFAPSSAAIDQQPPLTTSALRTAQFDDEYGKMIGMYQRAFQEIIDFKNQYMEEVMKMRERVIKEREEILEYEKVKHQQSLEIQNLRAVYDKLGDMLRPEDNNMGGQQTGLNPSVQQNLHSLLLKQQQDVMRMSQTGAKYAQQIAEQQRYQQAQAQYQAQQQQYYQRQPPQYIGEPQPKQQQNPYDYSTIQDSPNPLEQSLNSDTKFVVVPQNRIGAQPSLQPNTQQQQQQLQQTWTQNSGSIIEPPQTSHQAALAQIQTLTQTLAQSLQGTSQLVPGLAQTPQRTQQLVSTSKLVQQQRPPTIPETIQELPPHQEEDYSSRIQGVSPVERKTSAVGSTRTQIRPTAIVPTPNEEDFNSRESSPERREDNHNSNILVDQSKLNLGQVDDDSSFIDEFHQAQIDPMKEIDAIMNRNRPPVPQATIEKQLEDKRSEIKSITSPAHSIQKTQQKTQERFHNAGVTGSSFYNATMQLQKQQEQTQQEELQKQLMRIYGTSSIPLDQHREPTPPRSRVGEDKLNQLSFKPNTPGMRLPTSGTEQDHELLMQTNINIANSLNDETQKQIVEKIAIINKLQSQKAADHQSLQNKQSSNVVYQQPPVQSRPISVKMQRSLYKEEEEAPEEVKMNNEPTQIPIVYPGQFEGTNNSNDIWNDPDLVPPPVMTLDNEDYEDNYFQQPPTDRNQFDHHHPVSQRDHDNFDFQYPHLLPGLSNDNGSLNGGTLKQLKLLSPPSHVDEDDKNSKINLGTYPHDLFTNDLKQDVSIEQPPLPIVQQVSAARIKSPLKRAPMSAKPQSSQGARSPHQKPLPTGAGFEMHPQPIHTSNNLAPSNSKQGGYQRLNTAKSPGRHNLIVPAAAEDVSDHSMSKKERDMLEVVKLIQKATDTTNSLLGNTDQFKFRPKKCNENVEGPPSQRQQVVSHQQSESSEEEEVHIQPVENDQIMSNIDMIIWNLEQQKGQFVQSSGLFQEMGQKQSGIQIAVEEQDLSQNYGEPSVDPIAALQNESQMEGIRLRSNLQQRPQSRPISGKQAYISSSNAQDAINFSRQGYSNQQASQRSVGKYAQMALNNIRGAVPDEQQQYLYDEVTRKYGGGVSSHSRTGEDQQVYESNQQVILRPVSSKSNSNRYAVNNQASRSKSRSKDRVQASQQLYYEDDEDELELE